MPKFMMTETIFSEKVKTARLGTVAAGQQYGYEENGKALKLSGDSAYVLCAAGDTIEGVQSSSNYPEQGVVDGFSLGGVISTGYKNVVFDGLQATPGTGVVAVGQYVVTGTVVGKGTALAAPLRVTAATNQGTAATAPYKARVVSLGQSGTGAVGTVGLVELF